VGLYKKVTGFYLATLGLSTLVTTFGWVTFVFDGFIAYVIVAWSLLIVAQDMRGYLNRTERFSMWRSVRLLGLASLPALFGAAYSYFVSPLSITHLVMASFIGEALILLAVRRQR